MTEKKWKYVYENDILIYKKQDGSLGMTSPNMVRNRPLRFDLEKEKAYIYSDEPIDGLILVDENITTKPNVLPDNLMSGLITRAGLEVP